MELFLPFTHDGAEVAAIEFSPFSWGETEDWREGRYQSSMELLYQLAGIDNALFRCVKYPDVDRVIMTFMDLLPPDIREDIATGRMPLPPLPEQPEEPELPREPEVEHPADWPEEHKDTTDPANFNPEEWKGILPERGKIPTGPGFDLGETEK